LFGRWQQPFGLSLSVLQQLVIIYDILNVTENLAFSDGDSVTKPTKPKWRDSNSVVDMISSGGYDSPRRATSHVHFRVNSVDDQSPTVVVYTHFQLINVVFTRKTL